MRDTTKAFYVAAGSQYLKRIEPGVPHDLYALMKLLRRRSLVLDIGCAGGRDSMVLLKYGFRVIGIDIVPSFVRYAKKRIKSDSFRLMDARHLKFSPNVFDAIWCAAVLHHLSRRELPKIVRGFHRVLKRGGVITIREKWGKGTEMRQDILWGGLKRRVTYFTVKELKQIIRKAGFKIVKSSIGKDSFGRNDVKWATVAAKKL